MIGASPWEWWADSKPGKKDLLVIKAEHLWRKRSSFQPNGNALGKRVN